jgi:hypothetical protein
MAVIVFCGLFAVSYPHYRYFVDPDAVAYLTMAKTAAAGEPWRLVNALWSPLHPAMVALCIRGSMDALLAAQLTNGAACLLILVASYNLFRRFKIPCDTGLPLLFALSIFLCYALYRQLFCDLWQVAFLLFYLQLITSACFLRKPLWWVLCGLLMALAAYSKVYSFYFLLLHFPLTLAILRRTENQHRFPFAAYMTAFMVQIALLLPQMALIHEKYGVWSLSRSGALNTSWTLSGHKSLRADIHALIPPPYPNSPYTWEDPYLTEGALHTRFESVAMIKSQIGHSIQSALQGVDAVGQLSPFLLIVLIATAFMMLIKRQQRFTDNHKILLLAAAIMPLGYLLLHFEARYIWLLLFIGMILGARWLEMLRPELPGRRAFILASLLFAASFVAWPAYDMKKLFHGGADVRQEALALQQLGIKGSFTSNDNPSRSGLLAYWMSENFYTPVSDTLRPEAILADIRRYRIKYYFSYNKHPAATESVLRNELGGVFPEITDGRIKGMRVFIINP